MSEQTRATVDVRPALPSEADAAIGLLDAAMLAFDRQAVRQAIGSAAVLVAPGPSRIHGALYCEYQYLVAIAVRPQDRGRGIGRALINAAGANCSVLYATCNRSVKEFFTAVGFSLTPIPDDRYFAVRIASSQ